MPTVEDVPFNGGKRMLHTTTSATPGYDYWWDLSEMLSRISNCEYFFFLCPPIP
jgi:hypothetical protein